MPRKSKRPDIYERQKQRCINSFLSAPLISEKYPVVEKIVIGMVFMDHDGFNNPEPKTMDFTPDSRAHFTIDCPYRECIGGGFNISSAVSSMIAKKQSIFSDVLTCQGWQDKERMGKYHCLLELRFKITVQYKK